MTNETELAGILKAIDSCEPIGIIVAANLAAAYRAEKARADAFDKISVQKFNEGYDIGFSQARDKLEEMKTIEGIIPVSDYLWVYDKMKFAEQALEASRIKTMELDRRLDDMHKRSETAEQSLREALTWRDKLREALKRIACSAPCCEGHESFNSPGNPCDQFIAREALALPRPGGPK